MELLLLLCASPLVIQASRRRRRQRQRHRHQFFVVLSIMSTTILLSLSSFTIPNNDDTYITSIHPNYSMMIHAYTINNPIVSRHTTTITRIKFDKFAQQQQQFHYKNNKLQQIQHYKRIFSSTIQLWGKIQQKAISNNGNEDDGDLDDKSEGDDSITITTGSNENDDNDDSTTRTVVSDNIVTKIPKRTTKGTIENEKKNSVISKKSSTTTKTKKSSKIKPQTATTVPIIVTNDNMIQNEDTKIVQDDDDYDTIYAEIPGSDEYDRIAYDTDNENDDNNDLENRINIMTFVQLQQQLRLRGMKISGQNKQVLINRLLGRTTTTTITTGSTSLQTDNDSSAPTTTDGTVQPVDVSEYLDNVDDIGKDIKIFTTTSNRPDLDPNYVDSTNPISNNPEVWGSDALLVDNINNDDMGQIIVDNLSRSTIEFVGSNETITKAYVVASYDSLKQYIQGGSINNQNRLQNQQKDKQQSSLDDDETTTSTTGSNNKNRQYIIQTAERTIKEIQIQREENDKQVRPVRFDDPMSISTSSIDIDDENRIITDVVLHRDYSDWGKYSVTGQQISSSYITGVLLLSDVYGYNSKDTRILAETIAFECQPIIVMVPDMFNNIPWKPVTSNDDNTIERNEIGQTIEEWRTIIHDEIRVSITIRAAAQCLREQYGCTSVVIFGTCYGGGRAIEIAANYIPNNNTIYDIDKSTIISYPLVNPSAVIAWYPTRYEQSLSYLFGPHRQTTNIINTDTTYNNNPTSTSTSNTNTVAVMCIFAENDTIPGATKADAEELQSLLEQDERIKDYIVKIFPEQQHGFAHIGISNRRNGGSSGGNGGNSDLQFLDNEFGGSGTLSLYNDDADIAFLLSTSFMETYSRIFLPTVGVPIRYDDSTSTSTSTTESSTSQWNSASSILLDKSYNNNNRNIREEIDSAINNYVDTPFNYGNNVTSSGEQQQVEEAAAVVGSVTNRMIDPTDPTMEDELIQLLRTMESPEQANGGKYKILDDDDLATIYAKLTTANPDFQIF